MSYLKKYIITGAPGTGKTTLINALAEEYPCMHEVSRQVILSEQQSGGEGTPWQDLGKFVRLVYKDSLTALSAHPQALFTDRSILDLVAYLEVEKRLVPISLHEFPYHEHYHKTVFLTPMWEEIYRKDEQRPQEFDYCLELEKAIKTNYIKRGFEMVELPKDHLALRVRLIRNFLKETEEPTIESN